MNKNSKLLLALIFPLVILLLAYFFVLRIDTMSELMIELIPFLPYLLLVLTGILAYRFNQSKIFYLALAFIFIQAVIEMNIQPRPGPDHLPIDLFYSLFSAFISLDLLVFCLLQERGIFSRWGFSKLFFICGQFLLGAFLISPENKEFLPLFEKQIFTWPFLFPAGISQLSLGAFVLSSIGIVISLRFRYTHFNAAAFGVLLGSGLLIFFRGIPLAGAIIVSSIALIMIISIIQNTYSMAYLDELTEIPGRRAMREEMMKLSGNYTLAMVDIDFFKKFNDTYGHNVGDEVLRMVASKLARVTGGGRSFRYGGEEFAVVFAGKKINEVLPHLEKLRESIAKSEFAIRGKDRPKKKPEIIKKRRPVKKASVTVSIGAAEKNDPRETADEVLKNADKALYKAKKRGRNQVCK